ncbi:MAG: hypothetical protein AB1791_09125 [Chloroflexota bacterium]
MSEVDQPLKLLVRQFIQDVASWLLGQEVVRAQEMSVELVTEAPRVDSLFQLELADGRSCLFHLEFQGRRSKPEMPRRQLNHLARLALQHDWPLVLESFVLYTETYAGTNDMGHYQIERLDGGPAVSWHYTPIHLWREPAEPLLMSGRRGIIPLMGLMRIEQPQTTLPEMVRQVRTEPNEEKQASLLMSMLSLMSDEEQLAMLESLVEPSEEFVLDTPFIRRYRQKFEQQYRQQMEQEEEKSRRVLEQLTQTKEQLSQAQIEIERTRAEVERLGRLEARRDDLLDAIVLRFNPPLLAYREFEYKLTQISDPERLRQIFTAALQTADMDTFMAAVASYLNGG